MKLGDSEVNDAAEVRLSSAPPECPYLSLLGSVTEKGYLIEEDRDTMWKKLKQRSENKQCFDCHTRNPTWMSSSFGILLCMVCSGKHRNLGSSISFVRSLDLDNIRPEELLKVEIGGNARARMVFKSLGWNEAKEMDYRGKIAEKYKNILDSEVKEKITEYRPSLARSSPAPSPARLPESTPKPAVISGSTSTSAPTMSGPLASALGHLKTQKAASQVVRAAPAPPKPVVSATPLVQKAVPSTSSHFTTTTSPVMKPQLAAQTGGFEFDFEEAFAESATAPSVDPVLVSQPSRDDRITRTYIQNSGGQSLENISANPSGQDCVTNPRNELTVSSGTARFANAASISSDDYFNRTARSEADPSRLDKFANAKSISSSAYFGDSQSSNQMSSSVLALDDETSAKLAIYSQQAMEKVNTISQSATEMVSRAAEWFSQISRS